MVNTEH